MFNNINDLEKLKSSIINYLITDNYELSMLINNSYISAEYLSSTGWHNEIDIYQLVFSISIKQYKQNKALIENFQQEICEVANIFIPDNIDEKLSYVVIRPIMKHYLNWAAIVKPKKDVLKLIDYIKNIMISVATGQNHIQDVNDTYIISNQELSNIMEKLGSKNPNSFHNLWDWYNEWKTNSNLNTYASRRQYVSELFKDIIDNINDPTEKEDDDFEPTGWERVDRAIYEMKVSLVNAHNEEQFQAIGMIGRETLIIKLYRLKIFLYFYLSLPRA